MSKWMNVTANLFMTTLVLGFFAGTVMAAKGPSEPNKPGHQMREQGRPTQDQAEMRVKMLSEKLNLTEKQQGEIKPIVEEQMKQMQAIRNDQSIPKEQKPVKMQETRKAADDKIEKVLTPEQNEKFKKLRQEQRERREARRSQAGKPMPDSNSKK